MIRMLPNGSAPPLSRGSSKISTEKVPDISETERQAWQAYQAGLRLRAAEAMTMEEGLTMIHFPQWTWRPDYYSSAKRW